MKVNYVKLKEVCDVFNSRVSKDDISTNDAYIITPTNLFSNNVFKDIKLEKVSKKTNDKYLLQENDILIKRLNPMFVNVFSELDFPAYASSNVIIVRPKDEISPQYIAAMFDVGGVNSITHYVKKGVTIQAISAKELSEVNIPIVSLDKQIKIGKLWQLRQRKLLLQEKLLENEKAYMQSAIKTIIKGEN